MVKKVDIRDNTVVEFVYDKTEKDIKQRWKVLRVREEKTEDYVQEKKRQEYMWDIYNNAMSPFHKTNREIIQNLLVLPRGTLLNESQLEMLQYLYTHHIPLRLLHYVRIQTNETNIGKRHKTIRLVFGKAIRDSRTGYINQYVERYQKSEDFPISFYLWKLLHYC